MSELIFKPGPILLWHEWIYDEQTDEGSWVDTEVTARATEYLFDSVTLDDSLTLADTFLLLDAAPTLQIVLRRDFCEELLTEARKGVSPDFISGYAPDGIEFLELYQMWLLNTATKTYQSLHRLDFHGVGYALRDDSDLGYGTIHSAGERIHWGISTSPLRELLSLPIRLNTTVLVCEDDLSAKRYAHELDEVNITGVNLGQVLHGILWELSWYGGPEQTSKLKHDLNAQMDVIHAGNIDAVSHNDIFADGEIFGDMDDAGFAAMFESIGEHKKRDVTNVLRELEDDMPVQAGLQEVFGMDVVVKPEFALLGARIFRTLFRESKN